MSAPDPPLHLSVLVKGPAAADVEAVAAGFFAHRPSETPLVGGARQLDDGLGGYVTRVRTDGTFGGAAGETFAFEPPPDTIPARHVVLLGLGEIVDFTPDVMLLLGQTAVETANALGFAEVAIAPEVKDAGVTDYDGHAATKNLIRGVVRGAHALPPGASLHTVTLLAGKANAQHARSGLEAGLRAEAGPGQP